MPRHEGNGESGRGGSLLVKLAGAAVAVGLVTSGVLVGCDRRGKEARSADRDVIPNRYLVIFHPKDGAAGVIDPAAIEYRNEQLDKQRGKIQRIKVYSDALVGFSATMEPATAKEFQDLPRVEVVQSKRIRLAAERPPFGLDRTGQRLLPLDRYYSANLTGEGVHVYVVDSGILSSNPQFANRVGAGYNPFTDGKEDCEGHGTHVAGTIGAIRYGIAKRVILHPVRVVGCGRSTDTDRVIAGLDWIAANAAAPAIVNMSLSGSRHLGLDLAVQNGINRGFVFTVAAGNVGDDHPDPDACKASPARVPGAITVGAMDPGKDRIAPFSSRGHCVDLFAPGVNILSARNDAQNYGALMDGTSMASAHAAGVAALYLEACRRANLTTSPTDVWRALNFAAGRPGHENWNGLLQHPPGSPNRLLHWKPLVQPGAGWSSPLHWLLGRPRCLKS